MVRTVKTAITRKQFERVRAMLEANRKSTRPLVHDLYDIFNAVLYRTVTGCVWRSLPPGSPPWRSVHEHFTNWTKPPRDGGEPVLSRALAALNIKAVPADKGKP